MDPFFMVVAEIEGREIVLSGPIRSEYDAEVQALIAMHDQGFSHGTLLRSTDGHRTWEDMRQINAPPRAE